MSTALTRSRWDLPLSFLCLFLYFGLLACAQLQHEPWGDEIHSWNIAKSCLSLGDVFQYTRYEGHPPLWYILLWLLSKCTRDPLGMQLLQSVIAVLAIALILFRSPFPLLTKALLPFGYFLLYEYGCLSRNYALALGLTFAVLILIRKGKAGNRWYYLSLFLLSSTHLFGILLAMSMHVYVLASSSKGILTNTRLLHIFMGALCTLPLFLFIIPPENSELTVAFWSQIWSKRILGITASAPLRSFLPLPAWWQPNFWNSNFLLQIAKESVPAKVIGYSTSFGFIVLASAVLKNDRNALRLFLLNSLLIAAIGLWFPLIGIRHAGFLYLGFIAALWMHEGITDFKLKNKSLLYVLLFLQIPGTFVALYWDGKLIFSNASRIKYLGAKVPGNSTLLSDYLALNPLLTYYDRPFYCLEAKRKLERILWTNEFTRLAAIPDPYKQGADYYMSEHTAEKRFHLMSSLSPYLLCKRDSAFVNNYHPHVVDSLTGAIERKSDYYLYEVDR